MAMKYRNYRDPLYYDPKANDKIFVPVQYEVCVSIDFNITLNRRT